MEPFLAGWELSLECQEYQLMDGDLRSLAVDRKIDAKILTNGIPLEFFALDRSDNSIGSDTLSSQTAYASIGAGLVRPLISWDISPLNLV